MALEKDNVASLPTESVVGAFVKETAVSMTVILTASPTTMLPAPSQDTGPLMLTDPDSKSRVDCAPSN